MSKNMKRSERRAAKRRVGERMFKYYHGHEPDWVEKMEREEPGWKESMISFYGNTKSPCSCHMCGNPRRSKLFGKKEKLTKQELIAIEKEKYDLEEMDDDSWAMFTVWHGPWDDECWNEEENKEYARLMGIMSEDDNDEG